MLFKELGLSAELLRAVEDQGYHEATPIQQQAIPLVLDGRDVLAGAQTGTGKTAGFTLPLLQLLQQGDSSRRRLRALVLTPTRELAAQVERERARLWSPPAVQVGDDLWRREYSSPDRGIASGY